MSVAASAALVVDALAVWQARTDRRLVVAIDGYGGSGKTTLADAVAELVAARVIRMDDRLRARPLAGGLAGLAAYYDWAALHEEVASALATEPPLAPLLVEGVSSSGPALADLVTHAVFVSTAQARRLARLHERISGEEWDERWLAAERAYFATRPPDGFDLVVPGEGPATAGLQREPGCWR